MDYLKLSKEISYALRHAPWEYELELDENGYVLIDSLLYSINLSQSYDREITKDDLVYIINNSEKIRHEISGNKIRALYGHSLPMHIRRIKSNPPTILYHGTTHEAIASILKDGLKPMRRQYVHLSADIETAKAVGKRRDNNPLILIVDTAKASANGVSFYIGNDKVWLADYIPPEYVTIKI